MKVNHTTAKRIFAGTMVLGLGALGLTACSGGSSGDASGCGDVTMSLWQNSTTGPGQEFWDKTVADFEADNPGVTIDVQAIQNEDLDGKLKLVRPLDEVTPGSTVA